MQKKSLKKLSGQTTAGHTTKKERTRDTRDTRDTRSHAAGLMRKNKKLMAMVQERLDELILGWHGVSTEP